MYGLRNKCVRLELYSVGINYVEGVAEWTERLRGLAKIPVRLPAQDGPFLSKNHFSEVDKVLYKLYILIYCIIFICIHLFIGCAR